MLLDGLNIYYKGICKSRRKEIKICKDLTLCEITKMDGQRGKTFEDTVMKRADGSSKIVIPSRYLAPFKIK